MAVSRVRFLTSEAVGPGLVRGSILASWKRSRDLGVAADHVEQPYRNDPEVDTPLTRTAGPVLRSLRGQLDGQPMSVVLTDPTGLVLSRETGEGELERHLERVLLAPGFNYSESFVGTNGIGTALEVGGPAHVFGHEHYAENLEDLACAAVPIRHPITGRTVGAIDLTCWAKDAGPLLLTLAKTTAEQIRQALLAGAAAHQLEFLQEYLRTCRRMAGIVFGVSDDTVWLNEHARTLLDPLDQAAMLAQATEALMDDRHASVIAELPSGLKARMHGRWVPDGPRRGALVVHVKLLDSGEVEGHGGPARLPPPGLVGSAPIWLRACDEVDNAFRSGDWLAVEGEPGVGKLALLRAVHQLRHPSGRLVVLDAAAALGDAAWVTDVARVLGEDADTVVVQHVDVLDDVTLRGLSAVLQAVRAAHGERPVRVAVTLAATTKGEELLAVLRHFPRTVEVPPLRLHSEDLQPLVAFFLGRLGQGEQLACSPEAMSVLLRGWWPGNAAQVMEALRQVVRHRRAGIILPEDLPPAVHVVSRRLLSQLESLERDAIVQALLAAHGNKSEAAQRVGDVPRDDLPQDPRLRDRGPDPLKRAADVAPVGHGPICSTATKPSPLTTRSRAAS